MEGRSRKRRLSSAEVAEEHASSCELPGDILVMIFAQLSQPDKHSAALVCRSWASAARDPSLWAEVTLDVEEFAGAPSHPCALSAEGANRLLKTPRFALCRTLMVQYAQLLPKSDASYECRPHIHNDGSCAACRRVPRMKHATPGFLARLLHGLGHLQRLGITTEGGLTFGASELREIAALLPHLSALAFPGDRPAGSGAGAGAAAGSKRRAKQDWVSAASAFRRLEELHVTTDGVSLSGAEAARFCAAVPTLRRVPEASVESEGDLSALAAAPLRAGLVTIRADPAALDPALLARLLARGARSLPRPLAAALAGARLLSLESESPSALSDSALAALRGSRVEVLALACARPQRALTFPGLVDALRGMPRLRRLYARIPALVEDRADAAHLERLLLAAAPATAPEPAARVAVRLAESGDGGAWRHAGVSTSASVAWMSPDP
eukprot:tig00000133_g7700.t1